jgi:hypothetical protein
MNQPRFTAVGHGADEIPRVIGEHFSVARSLIFGLKQDFDLATKSDCFLSKILMEGKRRIEEPSQRVGADEGVPWQELNDIEKADINWSIAIVTVKEMEGMFPNKLFRE